jgi:hypothetical protein
MRRALPSSVAVVPCALAAVVCGLAPAADAGPIAFGGPPQSDRSVALRVSADWLASYPARNWGGVELPGRCTPLAGGRRVCPIAIVLRARTQGRLEPWRCGAWVMLPASRSTGAPHRTSASCVRVTDPAALHALGPPGEGRPERR